MNNCNELRVGDIVNFINDKINKQQETVNAFSEVVKFLDAFNIYHKFVFDGSNEKYFL